MTIEKRERNERICYLREKGFTMVNLGKLFGLSPPRIRVIVLRAERNYNLGKWPEGIQDGY
jgi:hypothetical protein